MLSGLAFRFGFCGWALAGWMDALLVGGVFGGVFCFPGISPLDCCIYSWLFGVFGWVV